MVAVPLVMVDWRPCSQIQKNHASR